MDKMKKVVLSILSGSIIACSCMRTNSSKNDDVIISNEINMEHTYLNFESTKKEGNAHSGKYYSQVDVAHQFAVGYEYVVPDSLKNKTLTVYVSGWVREQAAPVEGEIVVALTTSKGTVEWNGFKHKSISYNLNTWVLIKDSITYTPNMMKDSFVKIGVVGQKTSGADALDIDDLVINYKFSN